MKDFLRFRLMITPTLVQAGYLVGVFAVLVLSFVAGLAITDIQGDPLMGIAAGGIAFIVGNLAWRVYSEFMVIVFSIHDRLVEIAEGTRDR